MRNQLSCEIMEHSNHRECGAKNQSDPEYVRSAAAAEFALAPTIDGDIIIPDDHIAAYCRTKMRQGGGMMIIVETIDQDED